MATAKSIDGTPTNGNNPWIDSLVWGGSWSSGSGVKPTVTYAFKSGFDSEQNETGKVWKSAERAAVNAAFVAWEAVANINFVERPAGASGTDMWIWLFDDDLMETFSGLAEIPDPEENVVEPLYMQFNVDDFAWKTPGSIARGGWSYATILHEIGHSLGLAHPHDGGTRNDGTNFPGVTSSEGDFGDSGLNQGIYTLMSYNDGWSSKFPKHANNTYGSPATPMALDIAAVQAIYGANMSYRRGDDTYTLPTANKAGTAWSCIWDAGGRDTISATTSARPVNINLNAADLLGKGAGGYVSSASGIVGGFTIANKVVIERALGGKASDTIIGNSAANSLSGSGGSDTIKGQNGNDRLYGGAGNDSLDGGSGVDTVSYSSARKSLDASLTRKTLKKHVDLGTDKFVSIENLLGGQGNDRLEGNAAANVLDGLQGSDRLIGQGGNDTYVLDNRSDWVTEAANAGVDTVKSKVSLSSIFAERGQAAHIGAHVENISLTGTASISVKANSRYNTIKGNSGSNRIEGAGGNDNINGGSGNDRLDGGTGDDRLTGGAGNDSFVFTSLQRDTISYLVTADDRILLGAKAFAGIGSTGVLATTALVLGSAAADEDDRILFDETTGALSFDSDGNGTVAAVQFAQIEKLVGTLTADDFVII
jgi:serralysin